MSATQAFADEWRLSGRQASVLVRLEVGAGTSPAFTVYATHGGIVQTPDGVWWEPLVLDVEPISAPGGFGTSDIPLCSTRLRLANVKAGLQSSGTLSSTIAGNAWMGSIVTIWLWERGLTSFADALQVFKGVVQSYEPTATAIMLNLRQRTDWNRAMPSATLDPSIYPRAPEDARGAPLPVVYGKAVGPGLRPPHASPYSLTQRRLEMLRGPRGLSSGALVDTGRGGTARPKVLAASHKVVNLFDPNNGTGVWLQLGGKMVLVNAQAGDVVNTATECGILVNDDQDSLVMCDLGDVVSGVTNPARNPRYCLEPGDTTFAELEYNVNARDLQIRLGSMSDLGSFSTVTAVVVYEASIGTNLLLQADTYGVGPQQVALAATTVPTLATLSAPSPGSWGDLGNYVVRVYYGGAAAGSYVKVYFIGLLIGFFTRRDVVVAAHKVSKKDKRPTRRQQGPAFVPFDPYSVYDDVPDSTELVGDYYWNVQGMGDGNPLVAGVSDALLEQAPHIYAHILGRFGGQQIGVHVEGAPTVFGSYTEAVADFKTWTTRTMPFAFSLSETSDVMTVLSQLAASSLSFIYLSRFDDLFHIIPWKLDRAANWFFTFTPREVNEAAPECRMTPDSSVVAGFRLSYGWSAGRGFIDETAVASGHSSGGQKYINLRDENLTVVASVNDRIDFVASSTFVCTLTPGAYTPAGLAQQAQAQMNAADTSGTREHYCSYAGTVTLGHNDRLVVNDGAVKTVTLDPGTYTMEQLATHATTKLNAASTLWTVSYSRTTGKFTFARSSGTAQLAFNNVTQIAQAAAVLFGFRPANLTGSLSYEGDAFIEEQRFVFGCANNTIDLRWAGGANGSESATPRTAASLFGFDPRFDYGRATLQIHVAPCPKSNREATVATTEALYGRKREGTYEGRFIYDGETAREMRNRIMDLYGKPRMRIEFTTEHAPDLERGRVIAMSGDFDAVLPYTEPGTDGSWVGKRFVVVETEQMLGPTAYSTRIVAVSLG